MKTIFSIVVYERLNEKSQRLFIDAIREIAKDAANLTKGKVEIIVGDMHSNPTKPLVTEVNFNEAV